MRRLRAALSTGAQADMFDYVDEVEPHKIKTFETYSDLSWSILRWLLTEHASKAGL
jgi:hypothetical protein